MRIKVRISTKHLDSLQHNLKQLDLSQIGDEGVNDIDRNIQTQGRNIGEKWNPPKYRKGKRLMNTRQMEQSLHWKQKGPSVYVIASRVTENKRKNRNVNIAHIQNKGCKKVKIPATKFMTFSKWARQSFRRILKKGLMK